MGCAHPRTSGQDRLCFLSTILQIFTEKLFFKFSLNFAGKILESRVALKSSLLVVDRRPL